MDGSFDRFMTGERTASGGNQPEPLSCSGLEETVSRSNNPRRRPKDRMALGIACGRITVRHNYLQKVIEKTDRLHINFKMKFYLRFFLEAAF